MRKWYLRIILSLFLFGIYGCFGQSTDLEIHHLNNNIQMNQSVAYKDFWEAIENLNLGYADSHALDEDHRKFVDALQFALHARVADAEAMFRELYNTSNDTLIRKHSRGILANLLFFQSKWELFLALLDSDPGILADPDSKIDEGDKIFAEAFLRVPEEKYMFPLQPTTVPTHLSFTGVPVIEIEVNGYKKNFWLDTGASASVVASDIAEECGIYPLGTKIGWGNTSTSKKIGYRPALIEDLKIGNISVKNHPVAIVDKKDLEFKLFGIRIIKIDGIIGWPVFQKMTVEIDYKKGRTIFKKAVKQNKNTRNLFWMGYPFVVLYSEEGIPLNFGFDTGADNTSIKENIFKKISAENVQNKVIRIGGAGGAERIRSKIVPDLTFVLHRYALHFKNIKTKTGVKGAVFIKPDGKLGSDIAEGGSIFVDYLNGRFELKLSK